jgi:hypothetical protein
MAQLKPGQPALFKVARRTDSDRFLTLLLAGVIPAEK